MAPGLSLAVKLQPSDAPRTSRDDNLSPTATIRRGRAHSCEPSAIDTMPAESLAGPREAKYPARRVNMQPVAFLSPVEPTAEQVAQQQCFNCVGKTCASPSGSQRLPTLRWYRIAQSCSTLRLCGGLRVSANRRKLP